ncbi:Uncharacterized protein C18orf63 [Lonchura striata]|uniref:Uncharacterized protein C18orf63 n=1 Tax=Lonchura striata TaxID=40157 RepID=A0A218VEF7_9PASE|nr:Uncharacterized protein C18orf63 [Lonchura striata domestica]
MDSIDTILRIGNMSSLCRETWSCSGSTTNSYSSPSPNLSLLHTYSQACTQMEQSWSSLGARYLTQFGKDFLSHSGRQNAVVIDLNVSEKQLCISVEPCSIRLPPPEGKLLGILEHFLRYPLNCIRSQPVQYFPRTDAESVVSSFISDMKSNFSQLCGFPVKMTSKALYATKELCKASVHEIKPKRTKLDGEMVCVVSLTQVPPRKPTLPEIPSPCSTENSHWMERLIKEPGTNNLSSSSSSFSSTGGVSIEATEKSMSNMQIPGVLQLPTAKSLGTPVNSAFEATLPKVSEIIPIFKGKLMQMNGKITNQTDRKKKENAERHSPIKSVGVSSSMPTVHKSSITQIFKHIQNMPVKTPTDSSVLQVKNMKTHAKHGTPIFQWKTQSSGQMANSDFSENSASGGNPREVNHKKAKSPFFLKNFGPMLQKSNTSPCLNTHESFSSSARRGKKFTSQNTAQFLEKQHQSTEVHLQICKLDSEMTNSSLSLQQTKRSNKGSGLNIHESVFKDTVCMAKGEGNKAACHSKDCTAVTTSHHSKPNFEQVKGSFSLLLTNSTMLSNKEHDFHNVLPSFSM